MLQRSALFASLVLESIKSLLSNAIVFGAVEEVPGAISKIVDLGGKMTE